MTLDQPHNRPLPPQKNKQIHYIYVASSSYDTANRDVWGSHLVDAVQLDG